MPLRSRRFRSDAGAGLPQVLQDTNVQAGTATTFVYGLGLISMTDGSGNTSYELPDGLGSTSQLANSAGTITDRYAYDVFGAIRSQSGTTANDWRFTGQQNDYNANRGLYDLRARFYDPGLGRFLSKDPLPFVQRYAYAGDNPANYSDPYGLFPCPGCRKLEQAAESVVSSGSEAVATAGRAAANASSSAVDYASRLATLNCLSFGLSAVALGVAIAFPETATAINAVSAGWFLTYSGPVWAYAAANNIRTLTSGKENGLSKGLAATGVASDAFAYHAALVALAGAPRWVPYAGLVGAVGVSGLQCANDVRHG